MKKETMAFWFEDNETGENFFIEGEDYYEAIEIADECCDTPPKFLGVTSREDVEHLRYGTY